MGICKWGLAFNGRAEKDSKIEVQTYKEKFHSWMTHVVMSMEHQEEYWKCLRLG